MFTSMSKIKKARGAQPDELEESAVRFACSRTHHSLTHAHCFFVRGQMSVCVLCVCVYAFSIANDEVWCHQSHAPLARFQHAIDFRPITHLSLVVSDSPFPPRLIIVWCSASQAQALYELQMNSEKLRGPLREVHITSAKEVCV